MDPQKTPVLIAVCALICGAGLVSAGGFVSFLEHHEDSTNFSSVRAIVTTSDGGFLIAGTWSGAVTTMTRDSDTGALTWSDTLSDVGYVGAAALSPDNNHLYISTGYDDSVLVYSRHPGTGALTYVAEYIDGDGDITGLELTVAITVSADGKHVYAAGANANSLAVFSRDPTSGQLTFVEVHTDGADGVDGLYNPRGVVVAPGGAHVYVAGSSDDAIAIFSRDAVTGELTWAGQVENAVGGVSGLDGVYHVTSDPIGNHIYSSGKAVAVFSRDTNTGLLTYVEDHTLAFSRSIALDHLGRRLYAISETGDSLTVFDRDLNTGALTLSDTATDGFDGVSGMDGPFSVALDPSSHTAYAGTTNDTLAVFEIGVFRDGFESGDTSGW